MVLPALLLVGLTACLLTGCHPFHVMDGPDMEYQGDDIEPAEESEPDAPETETDDLSAERTETPCGAIEMPTPDLEKLPGSDARLAGQAAWQG